MYDVEITTADGTVTKSVMTWRQVRRYLPGGKLFGTVDRVQAYRIVDGQ